MKDKLIAIIIVTLIVDLVDFICVDLLVKIEESHPNGECNVPNVPTTCYNHPSRRIRRHEIITLADAKGVAGLGKAGGDGQGGSDKAGQQVPPEVYMALTYAGSLFLLTLSAPLILYSLNKLLNKILDCFGCGPSNKKQEVSAIDIKNSSKLKQAKQEIQTISKEVSAGLPSSMSPMNQSHQNQLLHQMIMQQQYSKHHPSHAFNSSNSNGSLATNNFVNNTSHHGTPSPANNESGQPTSAAAAAVTFPFDIEANYKTTSVGATTTSSSSATSHQHRKDKQSYITPTPRV